MKRLTILTLNGALKDTGRTLPLIGCFILLYYIGMYTIYNQWVKDKPDVYYTYTPNSGNMYPGQFCSVVFTTLSTIESKPHTGATINTPVGNNVIGIQRWSTISTWVNNSKPGINDIVLIPANSVVVLDEPIQVKGIRVLGKLIVSLQQNINITTDFIQVDGVNGYFEWGTELQPYSQRGVLTLTGSVSSADVNSKALLAMGGGRIEIHGAVKQSWSTLATNIEPNSNTFQLSHTQHNWKIGDEIVVVSTRLDWKEAEKRTITSIQGAIITVDRNFDFYHSGLNRNYSNGSRSWTLDMRAEVGLLTKSIKIQGDAASVTSKLGGHIMVMGGGFARIENAELHRMGQQKILGRYPFHWHMLLSGGTNQYFRNNSVHDAYNRAITIHGTDNTTVENNFCYNHVGHGIFLEDGSERFNTIRNNVVLLTTKPSPNEALLESDFIHDEVQNRSPASFWITNPNNTFEGNIAAGTEGTGFWFALADRPLGLSRSNTTFASMIPFYEPLGTFNGNKAHSCVSGFDIFDRVKEEDVNGIKVEKLMANWHWELSQPTYFNNCTWYANDLALYGGIGLSRRFTEKAIFRNNVFADNVTCMMFAAYTETTQSIFIAKSGENTSNNIYTRVLHRAYDGANSITNSHLVGWNGDNVSFTENNGGANKQANYRMRGLSLDHQGPPNMKLPNNFWVKPTGNDRSGGYEHFPRVWNYIIWDQDGTLSKRANSSIVPKHQLCLDGTETRFENWENVYRSNYRFSYLQLDLRSQEQISGTLIRTKANTPKAGIHYVNTYGVRTLVYPVILSNGFDYRLQFERLPSDCKSLSISYEDLYVANDKTLLRIAEFGKLGGVQVNSIPRVANLSTLLTTASSAYCIDNGDLVIQGVNALVNGLVPTEMKFLVTWSTNIALQTLDSDRDGITDIQEVYNGTDPIPNDPIREPLATPISPCTTSISVTTPIVETGSPVTLTSSLASGYQWYKNSLLIVGATNQTYSTDQVGEYRVDTRSSSGCLTSSNTLSLEHQGLNYWNFNQSLDGWRAWNHSTISETPTALRIDINGNDPFMLSPNGLKIDATRQKYLIVRLQNNTTANQAEFFWTAPNGRINWGQARVSFPIEPNSAMKTYIVDLSLQPNWNGIINQLRIDPISGNGVSSGTVLIDYLKFSGVYPTTPFIVPGIVEAENYNRGGQHNAYFDTNFNNISGAYRYDMVDIESAGGITNLSFIAPGEYTEYIVNQTTVGSYKLNLRVASPVDNQRIQVWVDDIALPIYSIPNTGGWQTYTSIGVDLNNFASGLHLIKLVYLTGGINVDNFSISTLSAIQIQPYISYNQSDWISTSQANICIGGTVYFGPHPWNSSDAQWSWTGPNGFSAVGRSQSIRCTTITQSGVYRATYRDSNGATATQDFTVNIIPLPNVTISGGTNIVNGSTTVLTASSGFTSYQWYRGTTLIPSATNSTYTLSSSGSYQVEVTNASGCRNRSLNHTVTVVTASPVLTYWDFVSSTEGWSRLNQSAIQWVGGKLNVSVLGWDAQIQSPENLKIPTHDYKYVVITMKNNSQDNKAEFFWSTTAAPNFNAQRRKEIAIIPNDNVQRSYVIDLSNDPLWTGELYRLRLDPVMNVSSGLIEIESIQLTNFYGNSISRIPGIIEAENYNVGGFGNAYKDTDVQNSGAAYRTDDVDIASNGNVQVIGWTAAGEYLEYLVQCSQPGTYRFNLDYAAITAGARVELLINGIPAGQFVLGSTGGWYTIQTVTLASSIPQSGVYNIRLVMLTGGFNIDRLRIETLSTLALKTYSVPMPFENETTVMLLEDNLNIESIEIYTSTGTYIYSIQNLSTNEVILGKELPPGVYVAYLKTSTGLLTTVKLIKTD